jgi:hypothetical protein
MNLIRKCKLSINLIARYLSPGRELGADSRGGQLLRGFPGFFSFPLLSEYQGEQKKLPTFLHRFGEEVVWNHRLLLWSRGLGLDGFSTGEGA